MSSTRSRQTVIRGTTELRPRRLAAGLAAALTAVLPAEPILAQSVTYMVTNCQDSGFGSLRWAVDQIEGSFLNTGTADMSQLTCSHITLDTPISTFLSYLTLRGDPTAILGRPEIKAAPSNAEGLLRQDSYHGPDGQTLTVEYLELDGGLVHENNAYGGCINSVWGSVVVKDSYINDCKTYAFTSADARARGGAVYAFRDVTIIDSTFKYNQADTNFSTNTEAWGGAVFARGTVTISGSYFKGNTADHGNAIVGRYGVSASDSTFIHGHGGAAIVARNLDLQRSTISGNDGGGIRIAPEATTYAHIDSSTVAANGGTGVYAYLPLDPYGNWNDFSMAIENSTISSNDGGGVVVYNNPAGVSSFLANNTITDNLVRPASGNCSINAGGLQMISVQGQALELVSNIISGNGCVRELYGYELYYASDMAQNLNTGITITGSHNLVGVIRPNVQLPGDTIQQQDTPLGPLQDNGGDTDSHMPLSGSWAFNMGTVISHGGDPAPTTDQRGEPRTVGSGVDIGSVESDAIFIGPFERPPLLYDIGSPPGG